MIARRPRAIVIGASAGGLDAIGRILATLTEPLDIPILIVQHLHPTESTAFASFLDYRTVATVSDAHDKEPIRAGRVYVAPANYHLLVEADETLALSVDEKVKFSRPSIDVLFESAAYVWSDKLLGVVLTGASDDGADGVRCIKRLGGSVIVQDPETAEQRTMPAAAIEAAPVDAVLSLEQIAELIKSVGATTLRGSGDD